MPLTAAAYEHLGLLYLGRVLDAVAAPTDEPLLLDSRDLTTHAVCLGMTGSGKTGLCLSLIEEAALDGIPVLAVDPKGDLANLLLTFPELRGEDLEPWVDAEEARRRGLSPAQHAAAEATRWREGLSGWGIATERIARLRAAADVAVYTPGSGAGRPLALLASLAAPPAAVRDDPELLAERVDAVVAALLQLSGVEGTARTAREHVLLAQLLGHAWRAGRDLDLGALVRLAQAPPFARVGVVDLEAFFPAAQRQQLAMRLNALLAAPGAAAWLQGENADIGRLLWTAEGRPRIAIVSLAHLAERERSAAVALLLGGLLTWMRAQPGTGSLRALCFLDEIAGYAPPVAEPPSKRPLLTLFKQARAYGVGMVVATQNPVDLDYKALANAGTWFIGRMQTARDRARVLDGLAETSAGAALVADRAAADALLARLEKRCFLLHSVHADAPVVFESRWAMSYLRGPMTREDLRRIQAPAAAAVAPASHAGGDHAAGAARPLLPAGVVERFLPGAAASYAPGVLGHVRFAVESDGAPVWCERLLLAAPPRPGESPDWAAARRIDLEASALLLEPAPGAVFDELPGELARAAAYPAWGRALAAAVAAAVGEPGWRHVDLGLTSLPGEDEGSFRIRLHAAARERRDALVAELRSRAAARLRTLEDRVRRSRATLERERGQAQRAQWDSAASIGGAVLGALFGRRLLSPTNAGRAAGAMRSLGRRDQEAADVARAEAEVAALEAQLAEIESELRERATALEPAVVAAAPLERVLLRPRRGAVEVRLCCLAWEPTTAAARANGAAPGGRVPLPE